MRIFTVLTLIMLSVALSAQSPITLGNSNMPSANDTLRYTSINLNSIGNYTQTGTNFNWNFTSVISTTSGIRAFVSSLQTPYALFFLSFTGSAEKMPDLAVGTFGFTDYYNFYKKQTSPAAYIADGVGMSFSSVPLPSYYSDKDELYNFPLSYPKYDSTTYRFSTISSTLIPIVYTQTGYRVTKVDGWGTIKTPYGTEACLRLITTAYGKDSIKNNIIPFPLGFPNVTRSYQWMTLNSKIPYFEVSGNLVGSTFTPNQARYRGYKINGPDPLPNPEGVAENAGDLQMVVYPNPVTDRLILGKSKFDLNCSLMDAQGKEVRKFSINAGELDNEIDVTDLTNGIYFLQFQSGSQQMQIKFVKD